jgi:hypothetical protein
MDMLEYDFDTYYEKAHSLLNNTFEKRGGQIYLDSLLHSLKATMCVYMLEHKIKQLNSATPGQLPGGTTKVQHVKDILADVLPRFYRHNEQSLRISTR